MKKTTGTIRNQYAIAEGIFDLTLHAPEIAREATPGQFVNLYCGNAARLLPRPISICEVDATSGTIRLVYRVAGEGTREFSGLKTGDEAEVMGPLGKGFPLEEAVGRRVLLIGGGIGIPPMLETAKQLQGKADVTAVLGYRDETFLTEDFRAVAKVAVAIEKMPGDYATGGETTDIGATDVNTTDTGVTGGKTTAGKSAAVTGTVLDAIRENGLEADLIFACGPTPMLRAIKTYAEEKGIPAYLSLEERMACGVGACLACVCKTKEKDEHTQVCNARVCKEGPVFAASEVEL